MSLVTRTLTIGSLGSAIVAGSFLHPLVTGQVMHTTTRGDPIGLGLLPSAAAFVALALVLGLAAFCRHSISLERLTPSSSAGRRVATVAVVGLVISTAAIGGGAGTVQAGYFEGCTFSDSLTFAVGASLGLSDQDCTFWSPDEPDATALSYNDALVQAASTEQSQDSLLTASENFAQDQRSVAWAKAKISIINDLNNNATEAEAKANATQVVNEYYATSKRNVLSDYESKVAQTTYLVDATGDGVNHGNVTTDLNSGQVYNTTGTINITFFDNETREYSMMQVDMGTADAAVFPVDESGDTHQNVKEYALNSSVGDVGTNAADQVARVHDTDGTVYAVVADTKRYNAYIDSLEDQRGQVNANIDQYVTDVYSAYSAGEINSTDLANADPQVIGTQAATDYNSTGYYGLANSQLSALGLSGNETVSHVVNTTQNGSDRQIEGTLYYTGEDSQAFQTGTTYDPSTLNGSVYMTVASIEDGSGNALNHSGGFYHVNENFTVVSATDTKSGQSLNTTTMETRNYTTTNASKLVEEIERLQEQRAYYESQKAAGSGGISLDFGGVETGVILALLAVAFLATRD